MVPTSITVGLAFWPIAMILLHAVESRLHFFIICDSGRSGYANRKWHIWFVFLWTVVYATLFGVTGEWQPLAIGALARFAIFPMLLNNQRGFPMWHVGSAGMDRLLQELSIKNRLRLFWFLTMVTVGWAVNWTLSVLFNGF